MNHRLGNSHLHQSPFTTSAGVGARPVEHLEGPSRCMGGASFTGQFGESGMEGASCTDQASESGMGGASFTDQVSESGWEAPSSQIRLVSLAWKGPLS